MAEKVVGEWRHEYGADSLHKVFYAGIELLERGAISLETLNPEWLNLEDKPVTEKRPEYLFPQPEKDPTSDEPRPNELIVSAREAEELLAECWPEAEFVLRYHSLDGTLLELRLCKHQLPELLQQARAAKFTWRGSLKATGPKVVVDIGGGLRSTDI